MTTEMPDIKAPRMTAVWNSCGDYEKPFRFTKRVFEAACAIEEENADLRRQLAEAGKDAEFYRHVRTLSLYQFQDLWMRNLNGTGAFDDLVALAIKESQHG